MREVVFSVQMERSGQLRAWAESLALAISAPSLEELHHEAREALIQHFGPAHISVRARIRRQQLEACPSLRTRAGTPWLCA